MDAGTIARFLGEYGFDVLTGPADSRLEPLYDAAYEATGRHPSVQERADAAIGVAAGFALAGATPAIAICAEHLPYSLAPLSSLHMTYGIPSLLLVPYAADVDPEHSLPFLTESLSKIGIPLELARSRTLREEIAHCKRAMETERVPRALALKTSIEKLHGSKGEERWLSSENGNVPRGTRPERNGDAESRLLGGGVLRSILNSVGQRDLLVLATGSAGKFVHREDDRSANFYLMNSPGLAGPVGTGLALRRKDRRVLCVEPEDTFLSMIGSWKLGRAPLPGNLLQVVLGHTLAQDAHRRPTGFVPDPDRLASRIGFRNPVHARNIEEFDQALLRFRAGEGPSLVYAELTRAVDGGSERVRWTPAEIRRRFESTLGQVPVPDSGTPVMS